MKTLIMLCAHRVGSTAIFKMFQKHPKVGVCHANRLISNTEPNFWNRSFEALEGDSSPLRNQLAATHPSLEVPDMVDEKVIFRIWDEILVSDGPVVFDKSPRYLDKIEYLDLILKYREQGNDVRIFALIRDPRDVITSQYMLWKKIDREWESPETLEKAWLQKYSNLEQFQEKIGRIPVFKYEDFSRNPKKIANEIFDFCGVNTRKEYYSHVRPVNVGRYSVCRNRKIVSWTFTDEFRRHLDKYSYRIPQEVWDASCEVGFLGMIRRLKRKLIELKKTLVKLVAD